MLTKSERAEILSRINDYASDVLVALSYADTDRRTEKILLAAQALERLLEYVEEIS
jgi:hypothetical protein